MVVLLDIAKDQFVRILHLLHLAVVVLSNFPFLVTYPEDEWKKKPAKKINIHKILAQIHLQYIFITN